MHEPAALRVEGDLLVDGGFFPGKPYVNRGIGGQTTPQMLVRFGADVLATKPAVVVILAGTNDIAGNSARRSGGDQATPRAPEGPIHGVRASGESLLPVSDDKKDTAGQPLVRTTGRPARSAAHELVEAITRSRATYLIISALADPSGRLRPEWTDDGLHPNAAGYAVMAPLAEKAIAQALWEVNLRCAFGWLAVMGRGRSSARAPWATSPSRGRSR